MADQRPPVGAPSNADSRQVTTAAMPVWARLHLTHAVVQSIADQGGIDLLHVKGPSVDPTLRSHPRGSQDVDVLVRSEHLQRFLAALRSHGWQEATSFTEGSSFGHAANYFHQHWASVDVHRHFPGPTLAPDTVFEMLWSTRSVIELAHRRCATPDLAGQLLVLALHEARSHHASGSFEGWRLASEELRAAARALALRLGAEVPLAAATGRLEEYRDRRDYPLWKFWSQPESGQPGADRMTEWTVRLHAARGIRQRLRIVGAMVRVNRTHLRLELGHEPSVREIAAEYVRRAAAALRAVDSRLRQKLRRRGQRG